MTTTHKFTDTELMLVLRGLRRVRDDKREHKIDRDMASHLYDRVMEDRNIQAEGRHTLDEEINSFREVEKEFSSKGDVSGAKEAKQIALWLSELKMRRGG